MQFLIDESVGNKFANLLKNAGYDAIFAGDIMPRVSDEEILDKSEANRQVLITEDKDFGELIFRLERPTTGVIFLRTLTKDPEKRFDLLLRFDILNKAEGKFIVVSEGHLRVRKL